MAKSAQRSSILSTIIVILVLLSTIQQSVVNCYNYGPTDRLLSTDPTSPLNYYESKAYPNVTVTQKWEAIAKFYNDYAWPHRTKIISFIKRAIKEPSITFSPTCVRALKLFGKGLKNEIQWSYESEYKINIFSNFDLSKYLKALKCYKYHAHISILSLPY